MIRILKTALIVVFTVIYEKNSKIIKNDNI
jgi:hypothetical protein